MLSELCATPETFWGSSGVPPMQQKVLKTSYSGNLALAIAFMV